MTEEAQQVTEVEQDDVFKKDVYCTYDTIWVYSTKQCANCPRTYCKKKVNVVGA